MATESRPLRIAILTSNNAPGIGDLLASANRGVVFEISVVVSSDTSFEQLPAVEAAGIPVVFKPLKQFAVVHNLAFRNLLEREEYDRDTVEVLRSFEVDYVILVGYQYLLTEALVAAYPGKIIALHDGDLTSRDEEGQRRYAGLHAVREALLHGDTETRSSVFFVTRENGAGPLFLLSAPCPVSPLASDARTLGNFDLLAEYAELHRRWMQETTWGPMLVRCMEFLAAGRLQVIHDLVWIDGAPGACRMGAAPDFCREHHDKISADIPSSCPLIRREAET